MRILPTVVVAIVFSGCGHTASTTNTTSTQPAAAPSQTKAVATLQALGGSGVSGSIVFIAAEGGVRLEGDVLGLPPNSSHGFHIHEKGDCSAADGSSAGGHFTSSHAMHGAMDAMDSHTGDLGNLVADDKGVAHVELLKPGASLGDGTATDVMNRGLIVHAVTDDLKTQPTGASGARIACAVIVPAS